MTEQLEHLYQDARSALKSKDFDRASNLLRQILLVDENYKDASRLLAQTVKLRRRRWYNNPRIWLPATGILTIVLIIWLILSIPSASSTFPTVTASANTPVPPAPTTTEIPTAAIRPAPTPTTIPLAWKRIYIGQEFPRDNITAIVIDPKDADIIYVGTDNAGVFKSIDGALSWRPALNGLETASVYSLVMDPTNTSTLYAGLIFGGVYKTTDGGQSWLAANSGIGDPLSGWEWISQVVMDPENNLHLFYTQGYEIYETTNGAESWQWISDSCPRESISNLVIHPSDTKTLFASQLLERSACKIGIYKSTDNGKHWELIENAVEIWFGDLIADEKSGFKTNPHHYGCDHSADIFNANEDIFCAKNNTLLHSTNGGVSWEELINGLGNASFEVMINPRDQNIFYGQSRKTANGGYTLYRSQDKGLTWNRFTSKECNLDVDASGAIYCWDWFTLYFLNGNNWNGMQVPKNLQTISVNPYNTGEILAQTGTDPDSGQIYIKDQAGSAWQKSTGLQHYLFDTRFYFGPNKTDLVYAVTNQAWIYQSGDGGLNWSTCAELPGWFSRSDSRFAIDPSDTPKIYLASQGRGIFLSGEDCRMWKQSNTGLHNLFVNTLAIDPTKPQTVYAGTDGGAYVSFDAGETWHEINDGLLGATVVYSIVVDNESNVYAATSYGIFKLASR